MKVKICGITNEEDALMTVGLGADMLGFVFAPSTRQVSIGTVRDITRRLPPGTQSIGVFRDASPEEVTETVRAAGLTGAQLHGHETPKDAQAVRDAVKILIVAFPGGDPGLEQIEDYGADAVLLDAPMPGSGRMFDWNLVADLPVTQRVILAGGLNPDNVSKAIETVNPWGVDVSTGVEVTGDPLRKDPLKVHSFIKAARAAAPVVTEITDVGPDPFDWSLDGD
jgi:phosphoribosylanthranilate isomerase